MGGHVPPPQVLGYQLTLFGPRGADYARHITTGPLPILKGVGLRLEPGIFHIPLEMFLVSDVWLIFAFIAKWVWPKNANFFMRKKKSRQNNRPQFQNRVYCYRRCVLSPSVLYFIAILSSHQFTSINFITGCLIRYACLNSRLTVFVSCLQRLLVVSRLRLRTLAWRSLAIIRRLLIHSRASRQFIACEIF